MERRIFHRLVDLNEVLDIVSKYYRLEPLGVEEVSIGEALGRVLAEDIYAPVDYPPFDRSEVDGYAVNSLDLAGADEIHPVKLKVVGGIEAGEQPKFSISRGEAAEISTGAMVPRGSDSIVMVEYTKKLSNNAIIVYNSVVPGENIATTGSDISLGDLVLVKGTLLSSNEIGLLAGLGVTKIKVYRQPRIAVFSTGNEVIEPGEELLPGKVYDVNGWLITSSLREIGAKAVFLGKLPDDVSIIREAVENALKSYDIIITSGGTSAGLGDLVYRVFDELGEPGTIVHGIKIKPGKPTVIAVARGKLLIGLPGFPMSCYMVLNKIVKPIVVKLVGLRIDAVDKVKAKLAFRVRKPLGRTWLLPVALIKKKDGITAYPLSMKSGSISSLINSDGYAVLESGRDVYFEGEEVWVELFGKGLARLPELTIIGSNDVLIYKLLEIAGILHKARVIVTGSLGGWYAIKRGEADIAPTHLLDEETLEYNRPFLKKLGLSGRAVLVRGYVRRIGILVKKGNPKKIKSIEDFFREDVHIVNRTKGSGTRVLLDHLIKKMAVREGVEFEELVKRINGYTYEVKTHTAVAKAIIHGRADAGLAIEYVAKVYGLDFIPLAKEYYDFLISKESLNKNTVIKFLNTLKSTEFKDLINSTPGYEALRNTGEEY